MNKQLLALAETIEEKEGQIARLESLLCMADDLNAKQEKMIERLCSQLAASEHCPFEMTEEGCPRPNESGVDRFDDGMCVKSDRRSRFGAECWRMWAAGVKQDA